MKLVLLIGSGAVGKMTVGQELAKITGLKLFHNHMTIEPVIELFGTYNQWVVGQIREVIFKEFVASDQYGMIFTYMWAFDMQEDWDYIAHVQEIFAPYNTEVYCVELIASQRRCGWPAMPRKTACGTRNPSRMWPCPTTAWLPRMPGTAW